MQRFYIVHAFLFLPYKCPFNNGGSIKPLDFFPNIFFIEREAVCRNLSSISELQSEQLKDVFVADWKVSQIQV